MIAARIHYPSFARIPSFCRPYGLGERGAGHGSGRLTDKRWQTAHSFSRLLLFHLGRFLADRVAVQSSAFKTF
eukprot:scaffold143_cov260-Pinguiococcus_pyrenoidosus.AAC.16